MRESTRQVRRCQAVVSSSARRRRRRRGLRCRVRRRRSVTK